MVTTTIMTPNQMMFFFFKQKTAYEITASDWSSDVCSSDLDIGCAGLGVTVSAVRRRNIRALEPSDELRFQEGDVVVLLGRPDGLAVVEERLLKG